MLNQPFLHSEIGQFCPLKFSIFYEEDGEKANRNERLARKFPSVFEMLKEGIGKFDI